MSIASFLFIGAVISALSLYRSVGTSTGASLAHDQQRRPDRPRHRPLIETNAKIGSSVIACASAATPYWIEAAGWSASVDERSRLPITIGRIVQ